MSTLEQRREKPFASADPLYAAERALAGADRDEPPRLGVALSGGGNRSAAFSLGVLGALHEQGVLRAVDVISAVSGGSYALSWYLLQQLYGAQAAGTAFDRDALEQEMFAADSRFGRYLAEHATPAGEDKLGLGVTIPLTVVTDMVLFNALRLLFLVLRSHDGSGLNLLNVTSARTAYRQGIQLTYQVHPDGEGRPLNQGVSFAAGALEASEHLDLSVVRPPVTFPQMRDFARAAALPAFVFNTTVGSARRAGGRIGPRVFELGTAGFGSDSCGYRTWDETDGLGWEPGMEIGGHAPRYRDLFSTSQSRSSPFATLRNLNTASAISGAALSGTNLDQRRARRILRLTNFGLEYTVPHPGAPGRLLRLSDGGHSENLGAYALLRRGCRTILIVDAEYDPHFAFPSYRRLKDAARAELGSELRIPGIDEPTGRPDAPVYTGEIVRDGAPAGTVVYVKLAPHRAGDAATDALIDAYASDHSEFPQEPTSDQYFQPSQFRAYRALGGAIGRHAALAVAQG